MPYHPSIHHRRSIRLKGYDYAQAGMYFITICVHRQQCILGEILNSMMILNDIGKIIENEWLHLTVKYPNIELHEYAIMPNHFHAIIEIMTNVGAGSARPYNIVRAGSTRPHNNSPRPYNIDNSASMGQADPAPTAVVGNIIGYFKYQTTKKMDLSVKLWQRNYYENIIRNPIAYRRIADYIINNPANWGNDRFYLG